VIRSMIVAVLTLAAARMARRALRRGAGQYAEIMAALWGITGLLLTAATANTAKARNTEDRLNALVPRIPVPQPAPATTAGGSGTGSDSSSAASNSAYAMGGGTQISYDPAGSGNNGGQNSQTSGQIGSSSPHTHSMTHYHSSSGDLQNVVNSNQITLNALVPAHNALRGSHVNLIGTVNGLVSDHSQLIADHNNLKQAIINAGVLN